MWIRAGARLYNLAAGAVVVFESGEEVTRFQIAGPVPTHKETRIPWAKLIITYPDPAREHETIDLFPPKFADVQDKIAKSIDGGKRILDITELTPR